MEAQPLSGLAIAIVGFLGAAVAFYVPLLLAWVGERIDDLLRWWSRGL